ncbi:MAG TPA: CPBP family intramembrane glutamic endopeptidase [Candidatus Dormibacteraeota bacterium]
MGPPGDTLGAGGKGLLAILCLAAGVVPLAARSIPGQGAEIAYGLVVTAVYLAITVFVRRSPSLRKFWELGFVFFIFAVVQVLNNSIPDAFRTYVLHEHTVTGNPESSTIGGTVAVQLVQTLIAIVPIFVLIRIAGLDLGSVYARLGKFGRAYAIGIFGFVAVYVLIALYPGQRAIPIHGTITLARYLALTPALIVLVLSNGFQEEFLFRGLFLQRYGTFLGVYVSNIVQALVFAFAHLGVTYTPSAVVFTLVAVFPLGLIAGYLMRSSDGVVAPALFHAGVDIPIYLAFLTYVS